MDLFNLEKLLEHAKIADKIAEGVVDDQAYNVITKVVNESVLVEAENDIEHILHNGKTINDQFNLDDLETRVNSALGIVESAEPKAKVTVANGDNVEKNATTAQKDAKKIVADQVASNKKLPKQPIDKGMMNAAKPSLMVNDAKSFKSVPAVKQSDFVNANIQMSDKKFDNTASSDMKAMQKKADANKKFDDKGQNVPKAKFESYLKSITTKDNELLIESVMQAFQLLHK